jgi:hypothetical protein
MKTTLATALALLTLTGCESTRDFAKRHPVATSIGAGLLMGSIIASANHGHNDPPTGALTGPQKPPCTMQPDGSCR